MGFFANLFGTGRTRKVASGSLSTQMLLMYGNQYASCRFGEDIIATSIANTNSMVPTLDANCVVLLEKCDFAALTEGDIVTYRSTSGLLVCHRLNERTPRGWWPLGDGNGSMDRELVTAANFDRRLCGILYGARTPTTDL